MRFIVMLLLITQIGIGQSFETRFELSNGTETVTYHEGIEYYKSLADKYAEISFETQGMTDSGYPLHLVILSNSGEFNIDSLKAQGKTVLLINNAIHAGEPDGVEASMMFLRDLVMEKEKYADILDEVVIAVIPFYSIGGVLNRNSTSRVNQNGPKEYGFRGNAQNYDLNRDFIKCDTKNAESFSQIFHDLDPDIFIDTHVSNGADYQYVMTMDYAQKDKLGGVLSPYLEEKMMPVLYQKMKEGGYEMITYVNAWGNTPDKGFPQFMDWPRYSSGYAGLFHTIGFMSETHMLKPFKDRVESTYLYMMSMGEFLAKEGPRLRLLRKQTKEAVAKQKTFPIDWQLEKEVYTPLPFKGYQGDYIKSEVTGLDRLKYDQDKPFEKDIKYYNVYKPSVIVERPKAYIIPRGWHEVIDRLKLNGVVVDEMNKDSVLDVETYYIEDYTTVKYPYEGHYLHSDVKVRQERQSLQFYKGDYIVYANQWTNRYIIETLEPHAHDSFFAWNLFDTILQQKEGFSSYVFEDLAIEILNQNPSLKESFEQKKKEDKDFASSAYAQLSFIYKNSPHYEKAHLRYPVFRLPMD